MGFFRETTRDWEMNFTRRGASARRSFEGDWESAIAQCPKPGNSHPLYPMLTVDSVKFHPLGGGLPEYAVGYGGAIAGVFNEVRVSVDYSLDYRKPGLNDPPRVTWSYANEVLSTCAGRVSDRTGRKIDQEDLASSTVYPMATVTIDMCLLQIPPAALGGLNSKINANPWVLTWTDKNGLTETLLDVDAETLLYEAPETDAEYDFDNERWIHKLTYKFTWRPRSHNYYWEAPQRLWDEKTLDWKRNTDGSYQYVAGIAGVGDWATTTPKFYETGNFDLLIPR